MEQEIIITEPTRYAQFPTLKSYNAINKAIVAYKDKQTNGEYTRTGTVHEYTPEPEQVNEFYYMPALPELVDAGLFDGVVLVDEMLIEIINEIGE